MFGASIELRRVLVQDDVGRAPPISANPSRPASHIAFDDCVDTLGSAKAQLAQLHHELLSSCTWHFW
ncbi:hypothetical protein MKW92_045401, partial [Papaver armeniacum]